MAVAAPLVAGPIVVGMAQTTATTVMDVTKFGMSIAQDVKNNHRIERLFAYFVVVKKSDYVCRRVKQEIAKVDARLDEGNKVDQSKGVYLGIRAGFVVGHTGKQKCLFAKTVVIGFVSHLQERLPDLLKESNLLDTLTSYLSGVKDEILGCRVMGWFYRPDRGYIKYVEDRILEGVLRPLVLQFNKTNIKTGTKASSSPSTHVADSESVADGADASSGGTEPDQIQKKVPRKVIVVKNLITINGDGDDDGDRVPSNSRVSTSTSTSTSKQKNVAVAKRGEGRRGGKKEKVSVAKEERNKSKKQNLKRKKETTAADAPAANEKGKELDADD